MGLFYEKPRQRDFTHTMFSTVRINISGVVQGVGFRPFLYNLARKYNLTGFCLNDSGGILIEVQGTMIDKFLQEIQSSPPSLSRIESIQTQTLVSTSTYQDFTIRDSMPETGSFTLVSPDISICTDCRKELFNPLDRRYWYSFINCTNCGPRYSIIQDVPYDRSMTTMSSFHQCKACEEEYHDPANRRFHAQPNACPACGPQIWFVNGIGLQELASDLPGKMQDHQTALKKAVMLLKEGAILAIKGLGGFHLACDATNHNAVIKLRERKRRTNKPFALMAKDLESVKAFCTFSEEEQRLLEGTIRPIVILEKKFPNPLSDAVAPHNKYFGVMLPYTPLHYLLCFSPEVKFTALVMTSGNLADEPIVTSNKEAVEKLSSLADGFLLHNRDIFMRVDDSIVRASRSVVSANAECRVSGSDHGCQKYQHGIQVLRRSRGFVPETLDIGEEMEEILACGAELKNTFCLAKGTKTILSQHIGDLGNYESLGFFKETLENLKKLFRLNPVTVAHDLHPDYVSTAFALQYAGEMNIPPEKIIAVQHHHAHIVSCMAEHGLRDTVIGVAFDGTGYGADGNIWGGEFFLASRENYTRKAHLHYLPMPGGDKTIQEPWRMAVACLYHAYGDKLFEAAPFFARRFQAKDINTILTMIRRGIHSPLTSSVGRLFDAISSLLEITDVITFEGEAAIALEMAADAGNDQRLPAYPFHIVQTEPLILGVKPLIQSIVGDLKAGVKKELVSSRFHITLAVILVEIANILKKNTGIQDIILTGGVFQNRLLLHLAETCLIEEGFRVWSHERIPTHDGGISLGQAVIAWEKRKKQYHGEHIRQTR